MNLLAYLILPVLGSLFILYSQFYGMERMGTDRNTNRRTRRAAGICYSIVVTFMSALGSGLLNLVLILLIPLIGNRMFHSGKRYVVYYVIMGISVYLTDALVLLAMQTAAMYGMVPFNSMELFVIFMIVTARLLEFIVIRFLVFAVSRNNGTVISGRQQAVSLILPVFSIVNLFTLLYFMQIYMVLEMGILFIINLILLVGLNIYFSVLLDTMGENQKLETDLNLYRQQAAMQCRYYEREEKKYEESRKLIHDIRNHIQMMERMYQGTGKSDAVEYAGEIHSMLNSFEQKFYTSEQLLNIILNDKVRLMRQNGICEDIRIGDVELSFMKKVDVTTLFANLLDNAIAAAAENGGGTVKLRVNRVRDFLSVAMENSCAQEPKKEGGAFLSSKAGHEGLGLKNIGRVAEQYNGDIHCYWKQGIFYTQVMLSYK